jgi:N12 class adenine-specific DNA methylase
LLGEPSFFPHATEAVWTLVEDRSVYVVEHAGGAGKSVATIFLDDLEDHVAAIAASWAQARRTRDALKRRA